MRSEPKIIDVCAAVIVHDGAFLLGLRPAGKHLAGHWEFPGGKVRAGETLAACVRREVDEELGVPVKNVRHIRSLEHAYPEKTIRLHFMACELVSAESAPVALEHEAIRWCADAEADMMPLAPADRRFLRDWRREKARDSHDVSDRAPPSPPCR
ncbi:MAG: (deoxy)nucleoside triphosphate pyrophosphohydrolase [Lentisphaeria bacterium]|nr:(deoxy)nucleoside triphosphate pyrophosphohydrolase [Lentisphaeria bacterium]